METFDEVLVDYFSKLQPVKAVRRLVSLAEVMMRGWEGPQISLCHDRRSNGFVRWSLTGDIQEQ